MNRFERQSTTPGGLLAAWRWIREMDLCPILDSIQCPTLVLHRSGDRLVSASNGRYLAEHIPGARMVELDGDAHAPQWGDVEAVLSLTEEFLTGHHSAPKQGERVLATVLFTDIVDSTARAAALGDRAWRQVLDRHDTISRRAVFDYGGRMVKGTGDGVLATFDAPARGLQCASTLRRRSRTRGSRFARAFTRAKSNSEATMSPESGFTSPPASRQSPEPVSCWPRGR